MESDAMPLNIPQRLYDELRAHGEHTYPLEQFKEAIKQSLQSNRSGKILFQFSDH